MSTGMCSGMNRTWKDSVLDKLKKKRKKHKLLRWPLTVCIVIVAFVYNVIYYFSHNVKRLSCISAVFLFLMTCSSFSYPDAQLTNVPEISQEWTEIQENYEYVMDGVSIEASDIIDDNDVLEGYDNQELDAQVEIDQFTLDDILKANEVTQVEQTEEERKKLSADDWKLVLVNKQHPVPEDYTFTLGTITGNMKCDVRIIDELMAMLQAAQNEGVNLVICSPYRDYNRQTVLFNRKIDYYMDKGYSYMEAYKIASITVTVPGASEHQIGLALDIVCDTYSQLEVEFGDTEAGIWLQNHSYEYGFILRYPLGKEHITGIQYEPWHFRYVGVEAATAISKQGITLEEFLEDLN